MTTASRVENRKNKADKKGLHNNRCQADPNIPSNIPYSSGKIFPGFKIPFGSNCFLIACMSASVAGSMARAM